MTQPMRDRVMSKFRKSGLEFLVATDVAARGIDVENIQVVFNYDLPYDGEDYVHRIGRTGRQGRSGRAISFASGREVFQIRNIERYTKMRIHRGQAPTVDAVEEARANAVLDKVRGTLKGGDFKRQDQLIERLLEEGFSSTDIASALLHHLQSGDGAGAPKAPRGESGRMRESLAEEASDLRERRLSNAPREAPGRGYERRPPRNGSQAHREGERFSQSHRRVTSVAVPVVASQTSSRPLGKETAPGLTAIHERTETVVEHPPKVSRRTTAGQTRLFVNLGAEIGISENDVVETILGATGLPRKVVGAVDVRERHLFVNVDSEYTNSIIAKLNRAQIKGRKAKVKVA
jgi:ATP-dependent RNA helicase DeaD